MYSGCAPQEVTAQPVPILDPPPNGLRAVQQMLRPIGHVLQERRGQRQGGVAERVEVSGLLAHVAKGPNRVGSDESRASGYENFCHGPSAFLGMRCIYAVR